MAEQGVLGEKSSLDSGSVVLRTHVRPMTTDVSLGWRSIVVLPTLVSPGGLEEFATRMAVVVVRVLAALERIADDGAVVDYLSHEAQGDDARPNSDAPKRTPEVEGEDENAHHDEPNEEIRPPAIGSHGLLSQLQVLSLMFIHTRILADGQNFFKKSRSYLLGHSSHFDPSEPPSSPQPCVC